MLVRTQASVFVPRPRPDVFDYAVDCDNLAKLFRGYGPVPSIERAELIDATELAVGVIRRIHNSDGSAVDEKILELERPSRHAYRLISGIKAPFSWLVRYGEGAWTFTDAPGGTAVVWDYHFELTSPLVLPIAATLIKTAFRKAMQLCLNRLADELAAGS